MILNILAIFWGLFLLVAGAELLVRGASNIAKKFHIPEILIGLTIVAIGTSMPELIITIQSALQGSTDLIVGNSIGSNLCNLLLILGIVAIIKPIHIEDETRRFHIPIAFASTVLIFIMATGLILSNSGVIDYRDGIVLIILFIAYIIYPILLNRKKIVEEYRKEKGKNENGKNTFVQICFIIIGIVLLKIGGDFVVDYATIIAQTYGVSERIIGLTIVAIGTALPELVTSIVATTNNEADLAVGNLIGSSVFNTFLIFGVGSIITPLVISTEFIVNINLLMLTTVLIWLFCYIPKRNTISRWKGLVLVAIYAMYMVQLFI